MLQETEPLANQGNETLETSSNKATSFYSVTREKEIESLPSEDQLRNFDIKELVNSNQFDQNAFKILSLQLYQRDLTSESRVIPPPLC